MTAPRRRWSFSLRALFVLVTACALASPAIPALVAKYHEWTWSDVGGPGRIVEFKPQFGFVPLLVVDASDDTETDDSGSTQADRP